MAKGADHGERGARAYNGGLAAEPAAETRGRALGGWSGGRSPLKLKAFCPFSYKRGVAIATFSLFLTTKYSAKNLNG